MPMIEPKTSPEPAKPQAQAPAKFTVEDATKKLEALRLHLNTYAGKPGHNPFLWAKENKLDELEQDVAANLEAIQKLPATPVPSVPTPKLARVDFGTIGTAKP